MKQVVPSGEDPEEFLQRQENEVKEIEYFEGNNAVDDNEDLSYYVWKDSSGKEIDLESDLPRIKSMASEIQTFTDNYSAYLEGKKDYQRSQMKELLMLELEVDGLDVEGTMSTSDDSVVVW